MRGFGLSLVIVVGSAFSALAAPGDQWILGIHHLEVSTDPQFSAGFAESVGTGYSGVHSSGDPNFFGNSYSHYGYAGDISRVYWELNGESINSGTPVPSSTELYSIEYFGTPQPGGRDDYQPIESNFHGTYEDYPYDPHIPWVGQFSTNHQWIRTSTNVAGEWRETGPGPQAPASEDYNAPGNGDYMWLTAGSRLYAKWDFGFEIHRSWSALRLTQITGPAALEGDYNEDGTVDAADYVVWRRANLNGADGYQTWRSNFGATSEPAVGGGSVAAVPEPLSIVGWLIGAVWICFRRGDRLWSC